MTITILKKYLHVAFLAGTTQSVKYKEAVEKSWQVCIIFNKENGAATTTRRQWLCEESHYALKTMIEQQCLSRSQVLNSNYKLTYWQPIARWCIMQRFRVTILKNCNFRCYFYRSWFDLTTTLVVYKIDIYVANYISTWYKVTKRSQLLQ